MGYENKNLEIERFLHLKSEIRKGRLDLGNRIPNRQSPFCYFGFEMQESFNFAILVLIAIRHRNYEFRH
jgi:hypothetical protein